MVIDVRRYDEKQAYEEFLKEINNYRRVANVNEYYEVKHEIILPKDDKTKVLHRYSTIQITIDH